MWLELLSTNAFYVDLEARHVARCKTIVHFTIPIHSSIGQLVETAALFLAQHEHQLRTLAGWRSASLAVRAPKDSAQGYQSNDLASRLFLRILDLSKHSP